MRVLLTTDTVGGVWTFTRELSTHLLRRGHAIALISFGRPPSNEQRRWCDQQSQIFREAFEYFPSDAPLEWMSNNEAVLRQDSDLLQRVVESFGPDILHSNQFCYGSLDLAIPKLITAHSDVLSWADACKPAGLDESAWLCRYKELVEAGIDGADAITTPTDWMSTALRRNYKVSSSIRVILNGRTLEFSNRARRLQAVSVGRIWDQAKNIGVLRDVRPVMPIFIAGEQTHELATAPAQLGSATLLGQLSERTLLELFSESSIYIATSIYEPFGLALLEAALCGCAVLANDIPSLREVWLGGALYFRDSSSLSAILETLNSDGDALSAARERSLERASKLSGKRMADKYEALYSELTGSHRGNLASAAPSYEEFAAHVA